MSTKNMLSFILQSFCNVFFKSRSMLKQNLGDANRKSSYGTPHEFGHVFCDDFLPGGWCRFVGTARTSQLFQSR